MQSQKFTSILQIYISGSLKAQVSSLLDHPIEPSLSVQSTSNHGNVCGKLGLLINARFLFGLSFIIAAGQLITYEGDSSPRPLPPLRPRRWDSPTHTHFLCVCPAILVQHSAAPEPVRFDSYSTSFAEWWRKSWRKVPKQHKKGFNSLIILGAWILWKHRISCVFDGSAPNLRAALQSFKDESHLGQVGGAKGLAALGLGC